LTTLSVPNLPLKPSYITTTSMASCAAFYGIFLRGGLAVLPLVEVVGGVSFVERAKEKTQALAGGDAQPD